MEEPRPRPVGRPRQGSPKNPVARKFRQAYCGTVTLHDAEGKAIHTIRYGRMPKGDVQRLVGGMAADVLAILEKRPGLLIELLCDGAPEMWNLLEADFTTEILGVEVGRLVDCRHTVEKLGAAARLIHGEVAGRATTERWKLHLLNSGNAVQTILAELHASGREWEQSGEEVPVHEAITYLTNHGDQMGYPEARRRGLPIGSGNVEATCKTLFEVRFKRCGSRWKEESGEHVVQLRALALSDRWGRAMELTLGPLRTSVRRVA